MKNSPANGPGTPREEGPSMGDYGIPGYGQENVGYTFIFLTLFLISSDMCLAVIPFQEILKSPLALL